MMLILKLCIIWGWQINKQLDQLNQVNAQLRQVTVRFTSW